jgi:phage gp37-like protein
MVTVHYLNSQEPTIYDPAHWAVTVKENMLIAIRQDGDEADSRYTPLHRIASIECDEGEGLVSLDRDNPENAEPQLSMQWSLEEEDVWVLTAGTSSDGVSPVGLISA